jgi:hypothetical protein
LSTLSVVPDDLVAAAVPDVDPKAKLEKCHIYSFLRKGTVAESAGALNSDSRTHMNPAPVAVAPNLAAGAFLFCGRISFCDWPNPASTIPAK